MCDAGVRQACTPPRCLWPPFSLSPAASVRWQPVPQPEAARPSPPQGSGLVAPPAGRRLTATTALPQCLIPCACALGGGRLPLGFPGPPSSPWVHGSRVGWGPGSGGNSSDRGQARAAGLLSGLLDSAQGRAPLSQLQSLPRGRLGARPGAAEDPEPRGLWPRGQRHIFVLGIEGPRMMETPTVT